MAVALRKLFDVSGEDLSDATILCTSYCSNYQFQTCTQPCISYCPSICAAYSPGPAPSPSESDLFPAFPTAPLPKDRPMFFVTVSISALAAAFVFFTFLAIRRFCNMWYDRRRRRRPEARVQRFYPDQFVDRDVGLVVDHPIWHIRTVGLQPWIINKIAVVRYKKGDALIDATNCAVCLSEFQEDECLRVLPKCNHPFHLPCIDTWLRSHTNCPVCRVGIPENPIRSPSGDRSPQSPGDDDLDRENEMETDTENDSRRRIEIHASNASPAEQKIDGGSQTMGRSVSVGSKLIHPFAETCEMRDKWLIGTGQPSSSSSSSVQRSSSCNANVFRQP